MGGDPGGVWAGGVLVEEREGFGVGVEEIGGHEGGVTASDYSEVDHCGGC